MSGLGFLNRSTQYTRGLSAGLLGYQPAGTTAEPGPGHRAIGVSPDAVKEAMRACGATSNGANTCVPIQRQQPAPHQRTRPAHSRQGKGRSVGRAVHSKPSKARVEVDHFDKTTQETQKELQDLKEQVSELNVIMRSLMRKHVRMSEKIQELESEIQSLYREDAQLEARVRTTADWRYGFAGISIPLFLDKSGARRAHYQKPDADLYASCDATVEKGCWALVTDVLEVKEEAENDTEHSEDALYETKGDTEAKEIEPPIVCINVVNREHGTMEHYFAPLQLSEGQVDCFEYFSLYPADDASEDDD